MLAFLPREAGASAADMNLSSSAINQFNAPAVHGEITRGVAEESSQNSNVLVQSNNANQNGISIFQGYSSSEPTSMHFYDFMIFNAYFYGRSSFVFFQFDMYRSILT